MGEYAFAISWSENWSLLGDIVPFQSTEWWRIINLMAVKDREDVRGHVFKE